MAAFTKVNRELANASDPLDRVRALGRNHDLWSLLLKDLAQSGNRLPEALRADLIRLASWSMHYSIQASLLDLPIDPVLTVNRNILEGLQAQAIMAARDMSFGAPAGPNARPSAFAV